MPINNISRDRLSEEENFHDAWAHTQNVSDIDIHLMNESCTTPEMRFIHKTFSDVKGKRLLDLGCGLGEASVYFALRGAQVTAVDISQGMLDATKALAKRYGVEVKVCKLSAESLTLANDQWFDLIYAGNLFHHVDIESTLQKIAPNLCPGGSLISWDPVAYNPLINVYRKLAMGVRTADEHPLTLKDIETFKKYFSEVECHWFWLTTLVIFVIFALVQRRDPNKVRYWKKVIEEGQRWKWFYQPLERLDGILLKIFPFLKVYCWNVVIIARKPKQISELPVGGKDEHGT
jgi:SAM-dependent methyltransferase